MDAPTTTQAARRRRVLITAGLGAALAVSSLVLPSAASAVTPPPAPTVALSAPTQIDNDGTLDPTQVFKLTVNNPAAGQEAFLGLKLPGGLNCASVTLTNLDGPQVITLHAVSGNQSNCNGLVDANPLSAAGGATSIGYTLTVAIDGQLGPDSNPIFVTGAVPSAFELVKTSTAAVVAGPVTGSSNLVGPSAPVLATPPAAIVHNAYGAQVLTSGFPRPSYFVYEKHVSSAPVPVTTYQQICPPVETAISADIVSSLCDLNDGLVFNPATGAITASAATLTNTDATPPTYVIVANNGTGGATATTAAALPAAVPVTKHDVSVTVTIPVLFSDVAPNSLFGPDIYALAGAGVINGQTNGTFLPVATVNRQEFAAFAAKVYNLGVSEAKQIPTGPCTGAQQDKFTDVAVTSTFCGEVNGLANLGVINGFADGTFGGTAIVNREQITAFLYRLDKILRGGTKPIADAACPANGSGFTDVAQTNPFCGDIAWASTNGITTGTTPTTFQPNGPAQRQAAAAFIFRFAALEDISLPTSA